MEIEAFQPTGATVSINPTTSAQSLNLTTTYGGGSGGKQLAYNGSNQTAFVSFGTAATTSGAMPIAAGVSRLFEVGTGMTAVSVIVGSTATGNIYFTPGRGGV